MFRSDSIDHCNPTEHLVQHGISVSGFSDVVLTATYLCRPKTADILSEAIAQTQNRTCTVCGTRRAIFGRQIPGVRQVFRLLLNFCLSDSVLNIRSALAPLAGIRPTAKLPPSSCRESIATSSTQPLHQTTTTTISTHQLH